jgi:CelD/BcsL family acetyltransferase involved in cellulose biosynthesis
MGSPLEVQIRVVQPSEIDGAMVAAWADLEARTLEPNAFLSPYFVLPALRHLPTEAPPVILLAESPDRRASLLGIGVFERRPSSSTLPVPHLFAYRSIHSYRTGLLVDATRVRQVLSAFFAYFAGPCGVPAVRFFDRLSDGPLAPYWQEAMREHGLHRVELSSRSRSFLSPADAGEPYLMQRLPSRYKDYRRRWKRLAEAGETSWSFVTDGNTASIDRFLRLEAMGWKWERGTALRAGPEHEAFFREMAAGFASAGRLFLTEVNHKGETIASTSNLISGDMGFAFKLGWDPAFAKVSPGILNEIDRIIFV